jgi:hypothetical protein
MYLKNMQDYPEHVMNRDLIKLFQDGTLTLVQGAQVTNVLPPLL